MPGKARERKSRLSPVLPLDRELTEIGACAGRFGLPVSLVGGAVRDMLLGKRNLDRDFVSEGDPTPLVNALARKWRGRVSAHPRFGTFVLSLPGGRHLDFVTARKESYPRPGSLPVVAFSTLKDDLYRRDFTVNALALHLNGNGRGRIVDYYGGRNDLERRVLRILHRNSFKDDPTRIFRLARFAGRGFAVDPETGRLAHEGKKYLARVSAERIREEILAILAERDPFPSLALLKKWGILGEVMPGVTPERLKGRAAKTVVVADRLAALFRGLSDAAVRALMERLKLPRKLKRDIERGRGAAHAAPVLNGDDLMKMGYRPGPIYRKILSALAEEGIASRRKAVRFVFDKFPRKI